MATKKIEKKGLMECRGRNVEGLICNNPVDLNQFYDSWSPFNVLDAKSELGRPIKVNKLPFCKSCCDKLVNKYKAEGHSIEGALYMVCALNNLPYIGEKVKTMFDFIAGEKEKKGAKIEKVFGAYYRNLSRETTGHSLWLDFSRTDIDYKDIATKIEHYEVAKKDVEQLKIDWGNQNTEDYAILTEWFVRYTKDVIFENQNQEDWYRDLCLARLRKRKMEENNEDASKINVVQNQINGICNKLRIDEFESNKAKTMSEKTLFEKITLIDENNVKDIYKEPSKNYDLNKIAKYNKDMNLRVLGNMLVGHRDFNISMDDIEEYNNLE